MNLVLHCARIKKLKSLHCIPVVFLNIPAKKCP